MVHSFIEMGYAVEDAEMAVFSPIKNEMQVSVVRFHSCRLLHHFIDEYFLFTP